MQAESVCAKKAAYAGTWDKESSTSNPNASNPNACNPNASNPDASNPMAGSMIVDMVMCHMDPNEYSFWRLRVVLSRVAWGWVKPTKLLLADALWRRPFVLKATVFEESIVSLQTTQNWKAIMRGMHTYRSIQTTQEAALEALQNFAVYGCESTHRIMLRDLMMNEGLFKSIVTTMHSFPRVDVEGVCIQRKCISLLRSLVYQTHPLDLNRASNASVFDMVSAVILATKGHASIHDDNVRSIHDDGVAVLCEGAARVGNIGADAAMMAMNNALDAPQPLHTHSLSIVCSGLVSFGVREHAIVENGLKLLTSLLQPPMDMKTQIDVYNHWDINQYPHSRRDNLKHTQWMYRVYYSQRTAIHTHLVGNGAVALILDIIRIPLMLDSDMNTITSNTKNACVVLGQIAAVLDDDINKSIVAMGGIPLLVAQLNVSWVLNEACCMALGFIGWSDATLQQIIIDEGGVSAIENAVDNNATDTCKTHGIQLLRKLEPAVKYRDYIP